MRRNSLTILLFILVFLAPWLQQIRAKEPTYRDFKELQVQLKDVPRDKLKDLLSAVKDESAAVRYLAVCKMAPHRSPNHEKALVLALDDDVRWVRYAAAVKLGDAAKRHVDKVAPILVEALRAGKPGTFFWHGPNHTILALYKIGSPAAPHLAVAIDHPNEHLRAKGCEVLRHLAQASTQRDPFNKPLAALNKAIADNQHPASRPMYVAIRMKIDGDVQRAVKLLREDARSKKVAVRVATFRQMKYLSAAADQIMPLLIKALSDDELSVVYAAVNSLDMLNKQYNVDISAAVPAVAKQVEKRKDFGLRKHLLKFLRPLGRPRHCPVEPILTALSDKHRKVRLAAIRVLGEMGSVGEPALPALRKLVSDPDKFVREAARKAIQSIGESPEAD